MQFIFPIVGLSHFSNQPADIVNAVQQYPQLQLLWDDGNPYSPYAIAVYHDCQQIGMVADDYARILRASLPDTQQLDVQFFNTDYESQKMFWAAVDIPEVAPLENTIELDLTPIQGLGWPTIHGDKALLITHTMDACYSYLDSMQPTKDPQTGELVTVPLLKEDVPMLAALCNRFADRYGCSLSGDDRRAAMLLDWTIEDAMNWWINQDQPTAFDLYEPLCHLRDIHRHYANTPARCAQVYKEERKDIHQALIACGFLSDYQTILEAQHISLRQEQHEHEQWLMALPQNVFAFYKTDRNRFASKLFYLRLSWPQLLAVYIHLDCLELLYKLQGKRLMSRRQNSPSESSALNNDKILLCPQYSQKNFMQLDSAIREFLRSKPHRKTTKLAQFVIRGELKHVFVRNMGDNAKRFFTAFCQEYNVHVDYSDFKKAYNRYMGAYRKQLDEEDGYFN